MKKYNPKEIEKKWQKQWDIKKTFVVKEDPKKKKFYSLVEFPYPSGAGLHVGHPRPFTAMDVVARKRRMDGYNVLYPIGFDAFGLPTENYAIKTGRPPAEATKENIATFTRQFKLLGYSFDWSRAVDTTDPKYYKWTQWIFLQFFKHGLAYKKNQPINWCPKDKIGLANEEVVGGCCERCGTPVEQRNKEQWMLAITKYADKLLEGLKEVDYITPARVQQENWIGKSEGAEIDFSLRFVPGQADGKHKAKIFTTRPDTIFGATFLAISPELAQTWLGVGWQASPAVKKYVAQALQDRAAATREEQAKTGIDAGIKAVNPATKEEIPVWITNYVLGNVGTGAIMGVPAHDQRDFDFAKKFNLPIKQVIEPHIIDVDHPTRSDKKDAPRVVVQGIVKHWDKDEIIQLRGETAYEGEGILINSGKYSGLTSAEAKKKIIEAVGGRMKTNYKLRDWVFSRQRYWGEPIPLVFCEHCKNIKQKVLLIHGFTGRGDKNWLPWMKQQLEKQGFEVFAPTMSTTDHPILEKWMDELAPYVEKLGEDDIIVGHSLGGKAALHILERINKKIGHVYLVAPVIKQVTDSELQDKKDKRPEKDYFSAKAFWNAPLNWKKIEENIISSDVIFSDNDPSVPYVGHEVFPARWRIQELHNYEHFTQAEIPVLFENILQSKNTGWVPLPESELPLKLPKVKKYEPTDTGESPLASIEKWVKTKCPRCGGPARRETDTMPNWAGSSWYFLRYTDPRNDKALADQKKLAYWMAVDWYNGGMEHTVLHLLYSRFWNQFLYDIGVVPTREPYQKRTSHGMILGPDGEKMSKSRGNVINPDEMVEQFGTDAFRIYIMFMGPFDQAVMWDTNGLVGVRRFLDRVWNLQEKISDSKDSPEIISQLHQTIKKVTEDIEAMRFNTAIAKMMELVNELSKLEKISKQTFSTLVQLLSPFAPHIAEELWEKYGHGQDLAYSAWPKYDAALAKTATVTLAVQINGKVRDTVEVDTEITEGKVRDIVLANEKVQKWLEGKEPKKIIYIKGKLVSIVV